MVRLEVLSVLTYITVVVIIREQKRRSLLGNVIKIFCVQMVH